MDFSEKSAIWSPNAQKISNSNMKHFMNYLSREHQLSFANYYELYNWSIKYYEKFWLYLLKYSEIIFEGEIEQVCDSNKANITKIPRPDWFPGITMNFAENLLRFQDDNNAIVPWAEQKKPEYITYAELYKRVAKCAKGLRKLGVVKGDRVVAFTSNIPEAIIAMLATSSIGAIWSSCSPDFGFKGVVDRFGQIKPKILFAIDKYSYNGKFFDTIEKVQHLTESLDSLEKTIVISKYGESTLPNSSYMSMTELCNNDADEIDFEMMPFDEALYIMYSSGTTGIPKAIVHGQGGTLLQHYKELALHTDLKREDVISFFTTCGWMMWNWLVSSLTIGATIFLYDGSPNYPNIEILWKAIQDENITVFGTSPKFLSTCESTGLVPEDKYNLSSLRCILSTGSPLLIENYQWIQLNVSLGVQICSISGGTDIISCFMLGNPMLPVYAGEIQSRGLGMKVESWDRTGIPLIDQKGELMCTAPFPSMPIYFWNDEKDEKYHKAYFAVYPGTWHHGDFIEITSNGGVIVYGRSDATLNPGGVRIGTAEIYRIVEALDEVTDSIVVGQNFEQDVRVVLFVVLKENLKLDNDLESKIRLLIKSDASPRHVPSIIRQVSQIPVTLNGKKIELAVTNILNKQEISNTDAIANPQCLVEYYDMDFI
jgi:acetoacetyl-CoA synthetase